MNNTTGKNNYQILLEKLNDKAFAKEFKEQAKKDACELLDDILVACSGDLIVENNDDWGVKAMVKLIDILSIRHENFYVPDFAAYLQQHIFENHTHDSTAAFFKWYNAIEYVNDSVVESKPIDLPETADATEDEPKTAPETNLDELANHLSAVLKHPQTPARLYNEIGDYLANGVHLRTDEPSFIKAAIVGLLNEEKPEPLDLSEMSAESLNTDDTQTNKYFAKCLSEILKHPNTPQHLHDAIQEGLEETFNHDVDQTSFIEERNSPEYIERLLGAAIK